MRNFESKNNLTDHSQDKIITSENNNKYRSLPIKISQFQVEETPKQTICKLENQEKKNTNIFNQKLQKILENITDIKNTLVLNFNENRYNNMNENLQKLIDCSTQKQQISINCCSEDKEDEIIKNCPMIDNTDSIIDNNLSFNMPCFKIEQDEKSSEQKNNFTAEFQVKMSDED